MKRMYFKKSLMSLGCLLLLGCNSDSSSNNENLLTPEGAKPDSVMAYDKMTSSPLNTQKSVDLSAQLVGDDMVISSIDSDTPEHCFSYVEDMQKVNVEIAKLGRCDFNFTATNASGMQAKATLTLVSSVSENPTVPNVSFNSIINQQYLVIDLKTLIEATFCDTELVGEEPCTSPFAEGGELFEYQLKSETIALIESSTGATAIEITSANEQNLTISLDVPVSIGWHKISYELHHIAKSEVRIGEIFVSVGDEINQPPSITPEKFEFKNYSTATQTLLTADVGKELTVDLTTRLCLLNEVNSNKENSNCLTITDPDFDVINADPKDSGWKLIEVDSFIGAMASVDANNVFNTSFTFKTTVPGIHDVSYVIADHDGAITMGLLQIKVNGVAYGEPRKWGDLSFEFKDANDALINYHWEISRYCKNLNEPSKPYFTCYSAPLTHIEAIEQNTEYNTEEGFHVAIWTPNKAQALCNGDGTTGTSLRLPTLSELQRLHQTYWDYRDIDDYAILKHEFGLWPTKRKYVFKEQNGQFGLYSLNHNNPNQAKTIDTDPDDPNVEQGYVTCFAEKKKN